MARLDREDKQRLILQILRKDYSTMEGLADKYGITRQRIYQIMNEALEDPDRKEWEAQMELWFRREVKRLTGNKEKEVQ